MARPVAVISFLALCACGARSAPVQTGPEPPEPRLVLATLTLSRGPAQELHLDEGGFMTLGGRFVGTLYDDGRFVAAEGQVVELRPDGTVVTDGEPAPAAIDPDGSLRVDGEQGPFRFGPDGALTGPGPIDPPVTAAGLTPETRRTAMFAYALTRLGVIREPPPPIQLPAEPQPDTDNPHRTVAISASGDLHLDGVAMPSLEALTAQLRRLTERTQVQVTIAADQSVQYQTVVGVIDALRAAGVEQFSLAVQPAAPRQ